jgi:DNA primase
MVKEGIILNMSSIDEIKARIDIVDLVSETVQLRRSGKNYTGFCPFHANTRTPAFAVFPESGTWRCFGQCNEGGDIFKYMMKREGWDFTETLRFLADKAGVQLHTPTPEEQVTAEEHAALRALLDEAVIFYQHQLLHTQAGKFALDYLREKRGLKDETIEAFGLGYAPTGWDSTFNYFNNKGYPEYDLVEAGLVSRRDETAGGSSIPQNRPGVYDRFRHRLMFPIRDERGRIAGFGARILNPDDVPKFLNSPQTPVFDKGHLLYGLDRARKSIREIDQVVIVEGYLDVIALHQAGFTNAVSPMGTALTAYQLGLLKRFSKKIVLALDPDAAGNQATLRGLQLARETMERSSDPVFDARGLLSQEARLEADIRVTTLPEGMDPDEVVARDVQEWARIVEGARPVVMHVMEALASGRDLEDPKVKSEIANQVLPLIEDLPSPIERDTYRQRLARMLRVSERSLLELRPQPARPRRRSTTSTAAEKEQSPATREAQVSGTPETPVLLGGYTQEAHCLGIMLRRPDLLYQIDRHLQENGLGRLAKEDFAHADHQTIFRLLHESVDQDMAEPLNYVLGHLNETLMEVADEMLVRTADLDPNNERVMDDMLRSILDIRRRNLYQDLDYLRILQEEAQGEGDLRTIHYRQMVIQYTRTKMLLDKAMGRYTGRVATTSS